VTTAVGGARTIPDPDSIARDYLLLALRLDQLVPGIVDGYFGPADLKARVDMEPVPTAPRLRDDARSLIDRVSDARMVPEPDRRRWLTAQLLAFETIAESLGPNEVGYPELLERFFDFRPARRSDATFAAAATALGDLLPGAGSVADRLAAWDARFVIPVERLAPIVDRLVDLFRERARASFGLPAGEALRVSLVRDQPWSGYNWYDGGLRSRVDLNTDLPIRARSLVHTIAHETYQGHHIEHAWKEADLVVGQGRLEASVLAINAPECLISEGLSEVGHRFATPPEVEPDLLVEVYEGAGLPVAADPAEAREAAVLSIAIDRQRTALDASSGEAAMRRHADGASHEQVLAYLQEVGLMAPDRAAKRLEFIEHPLWRTYIHVYDEGAALVGRWLDAVPPAEQAARFGRLLHEQVTPGALLEEISAA
jgi:hypothetical protein